MNDIRVNPTKLDNIKSTLTTKNGAVNVNVKNTFPKFLPDSYQISPKYFPNHMLISLD